MADPVYPNRLGELMSRAGMRDTELGELVGEHKGQIGRWRHGSRKLLPAVAKKLAPHLGVRWDELFFESSVPAKEPTKADRLAAVRRVVWRGEDSLERVSTELGVTPAWWADIEAGRIDPSAAVIAQFCGLAGCPIKFIETGASGGMRVELAAWLVHLYPELMSDLLRE